MQLSRCSVYKMETVLKIVAVGIFCTIASLILRQYKSEYSLLLELAGICIIVIFGVHSAKNIISSLAPLLDLTDIGEKTVQILIKALGIAILTGISSDICRDNSNSALAGTIEFFGKAAVLMLGIPVIKAVAGLAAGLINS